ncbi:MAG TPA: hypothetical protein VLS89_20645 [Candidatus Nanopelagicales bacterium]|nr:hypothetical protein [Candidatus Nanopelagicales bacterium]
MNLTPARSFSSHVLAALGVVAVAACAPGCSCDSTVPPDPPCPSVAVARFTSEAVERIDILLAIDNSRSMADKQQILAQAVPHLVEAMANPRCIDASDPASSVEAAGPLDPCPAGFQRRFEPILDIHIGIISSSLGGHGADVCQALDPATRSNDDRGRLLARSSDTEDDDLAPATYQGKHFLAWDPAQKLDGTSYEPGPDDGEADLDADSAADLNTTALLPVLADMVRGVGQSGCGYESQLESWYRFLVDPEPYETITLVNGQATPEGVDEELLRQRADFLRPDSLLTILLLSDENDCSMRAGGQFYLAAQQNTPEGTRYHLPRPRSECAADPLDPCCRSCGQPSGDCPFDPTCHINGDPAQGVAMLDDLDDASNLRCFDQKRRFGIDFLYPIDRYESALRSLQIQNRSGELVQNPLFSDLDPDDAITLVRDPGLVFFAGVVGVPWQHIARDPEDLSAGLKTPDDLLLPVGDHDDTWEILLGDPELRVPPASPFMRESVEPRTGTDPVTGVSITPPGGPLNPINGSEYQIPERNDLQYACIFPLPPGAERDCSIAGTPACECGPGVESPLCEIDPATGEPTLQTRAKAYPGLRELALIRGIGSQGIVGSVCPAQLDDEERPDFGYRPAIEAILDRLTSTADRQCLPRPIEADPTGEVACVILEARTVSGACDCAASPGRRAAAPEHEAAVDAIRNDPLAGPSGWNCICEIPQLTGAQLSACQNDLSEPVQTSDGEAVHGFCYVDATINPALVLECSSTEQQSFRFVGDGHPSSGGTTFITCQSGC